MVPYPSFGSPTFSLVVKGLVELHRLINDGKGDSQEAEAVRDALDGPLKALNRTEKERAQWLSEDLYSVSAPTATIIQNAMNSTAQHRLIEALEARESRDWDRALALFRELKGQISPDLLSYNRGLVWDEADYPAIAAEFFNHASQIDPTNAHYRALYMQSLSLYEPETARNLAREVLANDRKHDPLVVAQAATIRFQETSSASDAQTVQLFRELIPIMERNLARVEADAGRPSNAAAYESTVGKLGIFYELLGNSSAAVDYFSRGLQVNPNNDGLLAARGVLLYGTGARAIADLERAAQLGSQLAWPYLFLAHHYLATSRFEDCRLMCETGLKVRGSDAVKSELEEWRAIAQAELGFPSDTVRAAFEAAVRLDASNELARRNHVFFEASLKAPSTRLQMKWEQKTAAAIRQFGLAERRFGVAA